MQYVYHGKQAGFRGSTIYPLNRLKEVHPDLYAMQAAKYGGREWVMDTVVSHLGLRWNDVIHCAPIHPHLIFLALQRAGAARSPDVTWFKIPVDRIAESRAVYLEQRSPGLGLEAADYAPFSRGRYRELTAVPDGAIAYYAEMVGQGRRPLLFQGVPHVLVADPIDVAGVEVIAWGTPPDRGG